MVKLSKKLRQAIRRAIESAAEEVVTIYAPECDQDQPEMWNTEQKRIFDQAHEVSYKAQRNIDALLDAK